MGSATLTHPTFAEANGRFLDEFLKGGHASKSRAEKRSAFRYLYVEIPRRTIDTWFYEMRLFKSVLDGGYADGFVDEATKDGGRRCAFPPYNFLLLI